MIHKKIQYIFKYLDRFFVPNERKNENIREISEVYRYAMKQWYEKVLDRYLPKIVDGALSFIKLERDGKIIDKTLITDVSFLLSYIFNI